MELIQRTDIRLKADPKKVILRFLDFGRRERFEPVIQFVEQLNDQAIADRLVDIRQLFSSRHPDFEEIVHQHAARLSSYMSDGISSSARILAGAYFTHEYSIQASALFNPSIVLHPDQSGLMDGQLRFIMSLRATGEGHISSIVFQTGVVDEKGRITLDESTSPLSCGHRIPEALEADQYELRFDPRYPISSRVLFPASAAESNGMEDARWVCLEDNGLRQYIATYTAYNGRSIRPQLIETTDFLHFKIRALTGAAVSDKGFALFPEKINGQYVMTGRQGGRNMSMMYSGDLYHWDHYTTLQTPQYDWDMVQLGNCGSPVKTTEGWLLLTHAVGPMRQYVLSMTLLDLDHPERVIATLDQPLMEPNAEEREGYVPNVLYTCGMLRHRDRLIIPYAMSDSAVSFATAEVRELLDVLLKRKSS